MMMNEIRMMQELWNKDEVEKSTAMGQIEDPKMSADEMLDQIINRFGFEDNNSYNFAFLMGSDKLSRDELEDIFNSIMNYGDEVRALA